MGVVYGSEASFEIARELMAYINRESKLASQELAKERGLFDGWEKSKYAHPGAYSIWFHKHTGHGPEEWEDGLRIRNHHTTAIAPTGTTSMIANTSSGCEPLFDVVYFKDVGEDIRGRKLLIEFDDYFLRVLEANGIDVEAVKLEAKELMQNNEFEGACSLSIPNHIAEVFITAREVLPEAHVRMQAAFQEHVDGAISKTINFPNEATHEDVDKAYRLAIDLGCKGLTVYRVGSREEQVLKTRQDRDIESEDEILEAIEDKYGSLETFFKKVAGEASPTCPACGSPLEDSEGPAVCRKYGYRQIDA